MNGAGLPAAMLCTLLVASCGSDPKDDLLGKWESSGGASSVEFFKDGTIQNVSRIGVSVGTYTFVDENRIKIEFRGAKPFIMTVSISGDELTVGMPNGQSAKYFRAGTESAASEKDKVEAKRKDLKERCANNLRRLWKTQHVYMVKFGGPTKSFPRKTGREFWLALVKTTPPLIDQTMKDVYFCPAGRTSPVWGLTTYRGPRGDVNRYLDGDPVGCCEPGGHPDGTINVLRKNGDVFCVGPRDALYAAAMEKTSE